MGVAARRLIAARSAHPIAAEHLLVLGPVLSRLRGEEEILATLVTPPTERPVRAEQPLPAVGSPGLQT